MHDDNIYIIYKTKIAPNGAIFKSGERGIRTPGDREASTVFKTAAFDHSASSPNFH